MNVSRGGAGSLEGTVAVARMIVVGMAAGLLLLAVLSEWMPRSAGAGFMVAPAGILGIVSPAIGYRLFHLLHEKIPAAADAAERHGQFLRAIVFSLAVTDAAGLFGIVVYALTGDLSPLIGGVSHMILTGALWPTEARLAMFLGGAP